MEPKLAWLGCVALAIKDGIINLKDHGDGIYEKRLGTWRVLLNGRNRESARDGLAIPPFSAYVEFNGWPAGVIDPGGGIIAAGAVANEDSFIAAVERELGMPIEQALKPISRRIVRAP